MGRNYPPSRLRRLGERRSFVGGVGHENENDFCAHVIRKIAFGELPSVAQCLNAVSLSYLSDLKMNAGLSRVRF